MNQIHVQKLVLLAALLAAPAAWADPPRLVVNDAGQTASFDCGEGGELIVNGSDNTLTVTGGCIKVVVNGSKNTVTLAGVDKLALNGADNKVTYKSGWKAKGPKIVQTGTGNKVNKQ